MSRSQGGAGAAFWIAVVFSGLSLVALNAKVQRERATIASLQQELKAGRTELAQLESGAEKTHELQREIENLGDQLRLLSR